MPLNRTDTCSPTSSPAGRLPVILCARTALGTINHTLLSLEALRRRSIPLLGIAFIGDENGRHATDHRRNSAACARSAGCRWLDPLTAEDAAAGDGSRQLRPRA